MRCTICGRPPSEECCALCHEVVERFDEKYKQIQRDRGLAHYEENFGFGQVNTEEANQ